MKIYHKSKGFILTASCLDAVHSPNGDYVFNTDPLYETGLQNAYPIGTVMSLVCDEGFLRDGGPETWECRTGDYHYGGAWFPTSATADCKGSKVKNCFDFSKYLY